MGQHDDHLTTVPAGWLEALDCAEADAKAGRTVSAESVLERMQRAIQRLERAREPADIDE